MTTQPSKTRWNEQPGYGYGDVDEESMEDGELWMRVPHRGALKLVLLRTLPFRYIAHWFRTGYKPCPGRATCTFCTLGIGAKARYAYSVWDIDRKRPGCIEFGSSTAGQIRDLMQRNGELPGMAIKLTKRGGVVNGSIAVDPIHDLYRLSDLPPGPDPEIILRKQWSAPTEDRG